MLAKRTQGKLFQSPRRCFLTILERKHSPLHLGNTHTHTHHSHEHNVTLRRPPAQTQKCKPKSRTDLFTNASLRSTRRLGGAGVVPDWKQNFPRVGGKGPNGLHTGFLATVGVLSVEQIASLWDSLESGPSAMLWPREGPHPQPLHKKLLIVGTTLISSQSRSILMSGEAEVSHAKCS